MDQIENQIPNIFLNSAFLLNSRFPIVIWDIATENWNLYIQTPTSDQDTFCLCVDGVPETESNHAENRLFIP